MAIKLLNHQQDLFDTLYNEKKPIAWAGSIRSGKTFGAAFAFVMRGITHPGPYIIAGKTFTAVTRNVIQVMIQICNELKIPCKFMRATQGIGPHLKVYNSIFYVFGGSDEASQDNLQGMTARGALLDEVLLMPRSFVVQAIARCSMPDSRILTTMNKESPRHWFKQEMMDSEAFITKECSLDDNSYIDDDIKARYRDSIHGHYAKRMLDNEWADATGRILLDPQKSEYPRNAVEYVIAVDPAQSGTTAALLFAKHPIQRHWVITQEYVHSGEDRKVSEHARMIAALNPFADIIIDPSGASLRAELIHLNRTVFKANNDVQRGLQITQFAINNGLVRECGKSKELMKELSAYTWDEKAAERGEDKPIKVKDHLVDCLRYFCMKFCKPYSFEPLKKGFI